MSVRIGRDGRCRWPKGNTCFGWATQRIYLHYQGAEYWPSEYYVCPTCAEKLVDMLVKLGRNGHDFVFAQQTREDLAELTVQAALF